MCNLCALSLSLSFTDKDTSTHIRTGVRARTHTHAQGDPMPRFLEVMLGEVGGGFVVCGGRTR